jgi:hypothetical protein
MLARQEIIIAIENAIEAFYDDDATRVIEMLSESPKEI